MGLEMIEVHCIFCKICRNLIDDNSGIHWKTLDRAVEIATEHTCHTVEEKAEENAG